jgi:hypothetical protein
MIRAANNAHTLPAIGQALDQLHLKNLGKEGWLCSSEPLP